MCLRVVDEAVNLAKFLDGGGDDVLQVLVFADVTFDKKRAAATKGVNLVLQLFAVLIEM